MPYCLPSSWYMPMRAGVHRVLPVGDVGGDVLEQAGIDLLGHAAAAPRLEQVGHVPPWISVVSFGLNVSFSRTVISIVTFGWSAMYSFAMSCQSDLPGSLFWMCHQSMVTGSPRPPREAALRPTAAPDGAAAPTARRSWRRRRWTGGEGDGRRREQDREPMTGSHLANGLLSCCTATRVIDAGTPPVGDDGLLRAIVVRGSVAAGAIPRARSRPAREEDWRDGIGGQPRCDRRIIAGALRSRSSSSKVANPVDDFGSATVGSPIRDVNPLLKSVASRSTPAHVVAKLS